MADDELRELLFADLPPLTALERFAAIPLIRDLADAVAREDAERAPTALDRVLAATAETRVRLQAWSLARRAGIDPDPADGRRARGVIVDIGLDGGTDTLAGYEDGTARYLNQGGGVIVWEARDAVIEGAVAALLEAGQAVVERSGPLDGPRPPAPARGGAGIWVLTDAGIHLGMGPFSALASDPVGGPAIRAALDLMRLLIERQVSASASN